MVFGSAERSSSSTRDERGRDLSRDRVIATGRGGAGNVSLPLS